MYFEVKLILLRKMHAIFLRCLCFIDQKYSSELVIIEVESDWEVYERLLKCIESNEQKLETLMMEWMEFV